MDATYKDKPFTVCEDNQGLIALAKNPISHQRFKHTVIRYHFTNDECKHGKVDIVHLPSVNQIADMLTKPVSKYKLHQFKDILFSE